MPEGNLISFPDKKDYISGPILKIPPTLVSPYNAQATLHFYKAFWALYLPVTVPGRVSDIWRSYFAQALFPSLGISLGFLPRPLVVQVNNNSLKNIVCILNEPILQDRNPHSYTADFEAELALYLQSSALVKLIVSYMRSTENIVNPLSLPAAVEALWIDFFERGYIEIEDVRNVQLWLMALNDLGYEFPRLRGQNPNLDQFEVEPLQSPNNNMFAGVGELTLFKTAQEWFKTESGFRCNVSNVTFGNADLHQGPRTDLASTLSILGQRMILLGLKGELKNYPQVNNGMRGVSTFKKISPVLKRYDDHSTPMKIGWVESNFAYYKDAKEIKSIDAFTCTFPATMCQLWMPFEESGIVYIPAHRYNLGRCTVEEWEKLNKQLKILDIYPQNTIGAMSRYDVEYMRYYTGLKPKLVPSYSGYYGANKAVYSSHIMRKEILIVTVFVGNGIRDFINNVEGVLRPDFEAVYVKDKYKNYSLQDLAKHRAVVYLPYSVMSYKMTELYALGVPMLFPSPKFFLHYYEKGRKRAGLGHDRTMTSEPYCKNSPNLEGAMRPKVDDSFSNHVYSPNVDMADDPEAEMYWLQFADFYDWPHITYFDSYDHLRTLMLEADFKAIHEAMEDELKFKKLKVDKTWCDISDRVKRFKKSLLH